MQEKCTFLCHMRRLRSATRKSVCNGKAIVHWDCHANPLHRVCNRRGIIEEQLWFYLSGLLCDLWDGLEVGVVVAETAEDES